jgi:hypothetical protein
MIFKDVKRYFQGVCFRCNMDAKMSAASPTEYLDNENVFMTSNIVLYLLSKDFDQLLVLKTL